MHRRFLALLAGASAAVAISTVALAGGWAQIQSDQALIEPRAGEPTEFGFTVLQHGVTPVSWVHPAVVITDLAASSSRTYEATQSGPEGHFVATITVSAPGLHTWEVTMPDLIVEGSAATFVALNADGTTPEIAPAVLVDLALAAVDARATESVGTTQPATGTTQPASGAQLSALTGRIEAVAANVSRLRDELTLMRTLIVGLSAALAAVLAVGAVLVWSRRRSETSHEAPASEAVYSR